MNDDIYLTDSFFKTEIDPGLTMIKSGQFANFGLGPITITLNEDAENTNAIQKKTANGFQIGFHTYTSG